MARYFPKSTVQVKEASPGNFIYKDSRKPFSGLYVHTSNNKFFAGGDIMNLGLELVVPEFDLTSFGKTKEIKKYNLLSPLNFKDLKDNKNLISSKTLPSEKDYEKGFFTRYFVVRNNNSSNIFEISKDLFKNIIRKKDYDINLYTPGSLRWSLRGDVSATNYKTIIKKSKKIPKIISLFNKLNEYYISPKFAPEKDFQPNIEGRFYPDGEYVPSNLPQSYKIPPTTVQQCANCIFNENNQCTGWKASIRSIYWCKSWQVNPDIYEDTSVEEFIAIAMDNYNTPELVRPSVSPLSLSNSSPVVPKYHPFNEPGIENNEKRMWLKEDGGDGKNYRWKERQLIWKRALFNT